MRAISIVGGALACASIALVGCGSNSANNTAAGDGSADGANADASREAATDAGAVDSSMPPRDAGVDAPPVDASTLDGSASDASSADAADGSTRDASIPCGTSSCDGTTQVCSHGVCIPIVPCTTDDQCENDTRCDPTTGCVPWDSQMPPDDPACTRATITGVLQPKVRCEFNSAPTSDPFPAHLDVQSSAPVVNFNEPGSSGPPSIVAAFTANVPGNYTEDLGIIRVLRGTDCTLEANLGGVDLDGDGKTDWIVSPATPAAGDLDGDGAADVVASGADGSTLAFTRKAGAWSLLWKAPYPAGAPWLPCDTTSHRCSLGWAGPSIHDLDDDGKPEVLREGVVFGSTGVLKSVQPTGYQSYSQGLFPILANLDQDALIEMTNGRVVWKWMSGAWTVDTKYQGPAAPGQVAIADFGAYGTGVPASNPEIAVVSNNTMAIYAITGEVAMPPVAVPGTGGGPPVIADFDGDGLPEIATAGRGFYTVYDIDCGPLPRPSGRCMQGPCDYATGGACPANGYIAWSRQSQDNSSNVTGSIAFDFEADGKTEIAYADECFTRIYDGTGSVLSSQYHSSCTWYESPVVADVDGDSRADLVVPSNEACAISCASLLDANGVDVEFPGTRCASNGDCFSGACDMGFCRCTATADCCAAATDAACLETGYACAPPPAGTPGTGDTCRAAAPHKLQGIRVYSDGQDNWGAARSVWNQHAYAVTNVNDDGTIPRSSAWQNNWQQPGRDDFRTNSFGTSTPLGTGDATAGPSNAFTCSASGAALSDPICNRGLEPIGAGLAVGFYVGGTRVCSAATATILKPGDCETVGCTWATPPTTAGAAANVDVVADDGATYKECKTKNDHGTVLGVFCP